jgi:hypothetical protein
VDPKELNPEAPHPAVQPVAAPPPAKWLAPDSSNFMASPGANPIPSPRSAHLDDDSLPQDGDPLRFRFPLILPATPPDAPAAEVVRIFQEVSGPGRLSALDQATPILPVGVRELELAIGELMNSLDAMLPRQGLPRSQADWLPWVVVIAAGGAAYEMGRRAAERRQSEPPPSFGPPVCPE